jgi:hypothetical protein
VIAQRVDGDVIKSTTFGLGLHCRHYHRDNFVDAGAG